MEKMYSSYANTRLNNTNLVITRVRSACLCWRCLWYLSGALVAGVFTAAAVTPPPLCQVEYIVSCVAASEGIFSDTKSEDWALSQWDIAALFGAVPLSHPKMKGGMVNRMPPQVFNRVTQVHVTVCVLCASACVFADVRVSVLVGNAVSVWF